MRTIMIPFFSIVVWSLALTACETNDETNETQDGDLEDVGGDSEAGGDPFRFPDGFYFGAATAGFQVDMGCPTLSDELCVDDQSDWYVYMTNDSMLTNANTYLSGDDPADVGPGHWELYENDYDLAANELKNNLFRMSIEWSRLFPQSTENAETYEELKALADPDALATYHAMFGAMRLRGLEPLVTLHHYTLPLWIHDAVGCTLDIDTCTEKGWLDPEKTIAEIAKYAGFCAREFGEDVDWWTTLNEPFAVLLSGYLQPTEARSNPPALMLDAEAAKTALTAMLDAHARMVDAVREGDAVDADDDGTAVRVGLVHAMAPVLPIDPENELDRQAVSNVFYLWNLLFLDGAALGREDPELDGTSILREDWQGKMDFIGLNYKMSMAIGGSSSSLLPSLSPLLTLNPVSLDLSRVQPRGLYELLLFLRQRYDLPIIITENNGQALWKNDVDTEISLVVKNLQWCLKAIEHGVDLRGYVYWSFMDNIEWNHGAGIRLGLYSVDPEDPTKARVARPTVPVYARIAEANALPEDLRLIHAIDEEEAPTGGVPAADVFLQ